MKSREKLVYLNILVIIPEIQMERILYQYDDLNLSFYYMKCRIWYQKMFTMIMIVIRHLF